MESWRQLTFLILGLIAFYSAGTSLSVRAPVVRAPALTSDCPRTENDWAKEIRQRIEAMTSPEEITTAYYDMENRVSRCVPRGDVKKTIDSCLARLKNISQITENGTSQLNITESKPRAKRPLVLPKVFSDPDLTMALLFPNRAQETIDRAAKEMMKRLPPGSKMMQWNSKIASSPSYLTVIPGEKEDLFVHADKSDANYLIIRSVKQENGKELPLPIVEFFFTARSESVATPAGSRCISCHRGGTIKINPEEGSMISHSIGLKNEEIMPWFDSIRPKIVDNSRYDMSHLGPPMGDDDPPYRTTVAIQDCAKKVKPDVTLEEVEVIKKQMNCYLCHVTEGPGDQLLRYPMHVPEFGFRVFDNTILSGHMPKQSKMAKNLRPALLTCLKAEYFGGFGDKSFSQGNQVPGVLMRNLTNAPGCVSSEPVESDSRRDATSVH